ncbi:tetraspanin family protein, partial [Salmonella sp. s51228]|uniref:tetraspanin family protein n=1 Tax=Salmonella sp. s51228 TaxID=3159652 RepID=UPI003980E368
YFATLSTYDTLVNNTGNIVYRAVPLAILVLVALLLLLVSLVGFLGSCCNVKILLIIYNIMLIVIICLQVAGGALVVIFSNQAIGQITTVLVQNLANYNTTDANVKEAIDAIQKTLQCCGANGAKDYEENVIPRSCCIDVNDCPDLYSPNSDKFRVGCIKLIEAKISESSTIAIVVAIFLALFQASGVVLSYILIFCNRREEDPKVSSLKAQLPKY